MATIEDYERFKGLAWIDVLNAAAWLVIVAMLEFEIRTGLKARASRQSVNALNAVKGLLYLGLVGFAIYWGIDGKPIDFWDAFLWIVALCISSAICSYPGRMLRCQWSPRRPAKLARE